MLKHLYNCFALYLEALSYRLQEYCVRAALRSEFTARQLRAGRKAVHKHRAAGGRCRHLAAAKQPQRF